MADVLKFENDGLFSYVHTAKGSGGHATPHRLSVQDTRLAIVPNSP
jgi:hypothetical protein